MNYNRSNYIQIQTVNGVNLNFADDFEIVKRNGTFYYLADEGNNRIVIFNQSWSFVSSKNISGPRSIKLHGNNFYVASRIFFFKTDLDLNIIVQLNSSNPSNYFNEVIYDSVNSVFMCPISDSNSVIQGFYYFDENLTLLYSHSLKSETPTTGHFSVQMSNGLYYSAAYGGQLKVFDNRTVIVRYQMCSSGYFTRAAIYLDRYVLASCYTEGAVKLFHINGTTTGFSFTGFFQPTSAKYTENNELIVCDKNYVHIFKL